MDRKTEQKVHQLLRIAVTSLGQVGSDVRNTPTALEVSKAVKKALVTAFKQYPEVRVVHSIGHFECFGFVENTANGKCVYFSTSDYRGRPVKVMYRTAKDTKDYTGGSNQWCGWMELPFNLARLIGVEL